MKNAGATLLEMLDKWGVTPNESPEHQRKEEGDDPWSFWHRQNEAVACMIDIERALDALENLGDDVEHYREALPEWYRPVYGTTPLWGTTSHEFRPLMDYRDRRLLKSLAQHLDRAGVVAEEITTGERTQLLATLAKALELVNGADYLTHAVKSYLKTLIDAAHRLLTEPESVSADRVRKVMFELGGALLATSDLAPVEKKEKWGETAKAVVAGLYTEAAVRAIDGGVNVAQKLIEAGGS